MLHLILILLSVLAAGVPMIGYLLLMRWLDRYEREPLTLVAAAFAWCSSKLYPNEAPLVPRVGGTCPVLSRYHR